jgi:cysteinyl-tRNA synthetase
MAGAMSHDQHSDAPLRLFNSLTRSIEPFAPIEPDHARVYSCGPTVYNYAHIGNLRAYVFVDTLRRTLLWKGLDVTQIINITDVGHLTSDADAGDDKMEAAARASAKSIWDIAAHYTEAFKANIADLNIMAPSEWTVATDYVPQMIE